MFIGGDEAQRLARLAQETSATTAYNKGDVGGAMEIAGQELPNEVVVEPTMEMFTGQYEVLVEVGSTEYRDPKLRQERLEKMFFSLVQVAPTLAQMGVNIDMNRVARLWLESTDIIDVDSLLQPPMPMGPPGAGAGGMPPELAGMPPEMMAQLMAQPPPQQKQTTKNTGLLETGQKAPAVPGYGEVS